MILWIWVIKTFSHDQIRRTLQYDASRGKRICTTFPTCRIMSLLNQSSSSPTFRILTSGTKHSIFRCSEIRHFLSSLKVQSTFWTKSDTLRQYAAEMIRLCQLAQQLMAYALNSAKHTVSSMSKIVFYCLLFIKHCPINNFYSRGTTAADVHAVS